MTKLSLICQIVLINCVILSVHSVQDDCPVGKYRCQSKTKRCIDLNSICDGKRDCPDGDDETSSYCNEVEITKHYKNYNPGKAYVNEEDRYVNVHNRNVKTKDHTKNTHNETDQGDRYWPNNGCSAGHYLCNGTLNICIKSYDICNGVQDCPHNDDEAQEVCSHRHPKANEPPIKLNDDSAIVSPDQSDSNQRNLDGTGFMFSVDNLIIYNSNVRMFNQDSDNNEK